MGNREEVVVPPAQAAYRREILALVGTDDPAEVQAGTGAALRSRVAAASEADVLRQRPEEREWSVMELVGHMLDSEIYSSARYRWVLGHDRPLLEGYDQDLIVDASAHRDANPEVLLTAWEGLRTANIDLWARSSPKQRAREGVHSERGPSTYEVLFLEMAGHDRFHLNQIDRTLEALGTGSAAGASPPPSAE
jgi:hypothetical protein